MIRARTRSGVLTLSVQSLSQATQRRIESLASIAIKKLASVATILGIRAVIATSPIRNRSARCTVRITFENVQTVKLESNEMLVKVA